MNDEQMQPLLEVWLRDRDAGSRDPNGGVARVVARLPEIRQRGRWWPLAVFDRPALIPATSGPTPARGSTMFSAVKFVVASVIVALFGGFVLTGVLTTPQGDDALPGAVTESPSPMTTEESLSGMDTFPSGAFVSVENEHLMLEFGGDGAAVKHDLAGATTSFTYAVDGDVYTWLTAENGNERYGQADYAWDYDGERLAFELLGEDRFAYRKWVYTQNTYQPMEDPQVVVVAVGDFDVGVPVQPKLGFVPAAEAVPDAYTSILDVLGEVAAVPISKGQVITPALLELEPAEVTTSATEPSEPIARTEILAGVTEEVEPGVLRVVNDGVRDLSVASEEGPDRLPGANVIAGLDGSVWVQDGEQMLRLGGEGSVEYPCSAARKQGCEFGIADVPRWAQGEAVAADGTFWAVRNGLFSHDGEKWNIRVAQRPSGLVAAPDGAVWATWQSKQGPRLGRFDGERRSVIDMPKALRDEEGEYHALAVTDDGDVWVSAAGAFHRYDGETWQEVKDPNAAANTAMGRDGTAWNTNRAGPFNAMGYRLGAVNRFDGTDWQRWDDADDFPAAALGFRRLEVMPDGRLWLLPVGPLSVASGYCDGVALFDGDSWTRYLQGHCVFSGDMAPDGSAWVEAADAVPAPQEIGRGGYIYEPTNPIHTYVITPEAVAATE